MRKLVKPGQAVLICAMMLWSQAFSCATAIKELEQWSPTVISAFTGIVTILNPAAGSGLALADIAIQKLFGVGGVVPNAIAAYQANPGTSTLSDVTAALAAANTQFNAALAAIQQNPNSQDAQAAEAGMLLLIVTLESIQAKLGTTVTTPVATSAARLWALKKAIEPA